MLKLKVNSVLFLSGSVIGAVIMEGYYVIFDRENASVGFAQTNCTNESNVPPSTVTGYKNIAGEFLNFSFSFCVKK